MNISKDKGQPYQDIQDCVCGAKKHTQLSKNGIDISICYECGLIRQRNLPFKTETEYTEYYRNYPPTKKEYMAKDYSHDRDVAKKRYDAYKINQNDRVLDVGSGSGAFIDICRENNIEAYGCEIGEYHYEKGHEFIYRKQLEDIHFPTDYFDVVTCHDTIEHVMRPVRFLDEIFRAMKQDGTCIIDMPNFFNEDGAHHWKAGEHIWFFNIDQFEKVLTQAGFILTKVDYPIESKVVFYSTKPRQKRTKILLPPGIGDSYWSITKLEAFLKSKMLSMPDVHVVCNKNNKNQGHIRAFPFLEMFPFINATWKSFENGDNKQDMGIWKEAYSQEGRTIFQNVKTCDYFISYCGNLGAGKRLEDVDPELAVNWTPTMFESLEQSNYRAYAQRQYGKYIVLYFVFQGTYKKWLQEFPVNKTSQYINNIIEKTEYTPILVGASWDAEDKKLTDFSQSLPGCIDLRGETTIPQLFGLLQGSECVIGYPSGLTIMSTVLGAKTIILWNKYYNTNFWRNCCPPETFNKIYFIENTKTIIPDEASIRAIGIMENDSARKIYRVSVDDLLEPENDDAVAEDGDQEINPEKKSIAILCVLKSGGDYNQQYVQRLKHMIERNTTVGHNFYCLTDISPNGYDYDTIPLQDGNQGWWAKVELFRPGIVEEDRILYLDLDSIITANIDDMLEYDYKFSALQPWNKVNRANGMCASGLMGWKNDGRMSFLYEDFQKDIIGQYPRGDQAYISDKLREVGIHPEWFQGLFHGIYSYRRACRNRLPADARFVCFHGKPRPHEIHKGWIRDYWK